MKRLGAAFLFLATAQFALATTAQVPELDMNAAVAALSLVTGGVLIARGRRKR